MYRVEECRFDSGEGNHFLRLGRRRWGAPEHVLKLFTIFARCTWTMGPSAVSAENLWESHLVSVKIIDSVTGIRAYSSVGRAAYF